MKTVLVHLASLCLAGSLLLASSVQEHDDKRIAVMGSSVASGWVTSYETRNDMRNGWAFRLERSLASRGYTFAQISVPGDTTAKVLARMDADLGGSGAEYAIIALSLGNEGLESGDPMEVFERFERGMTAIVDRCRELGVKPVVGLCYGSDHFGVEHLQVLREMNLLLHEWDVPSIDFLGAMDDGRGHFPPGRTYDGIHPDNRGHEEYFLAVPPGLFDALEAGKALPSKSATDGFVTVTAGGTGAPLSYVPEDVLHSFTLAFEVRTDARGVLASIVTTDGERMLALDDDGNLRYVAPSAGPLAGRKRVGNGQWHHVAVSHRHLAGETLLCVDGWLAGRVAERMEPLQLVLGGTAEGAEAPQTADYREWMVFRSALNEVEVEALSEGRLLRGSLEVYAPLAGASLEADALVENLAQSTVEVHARPTHAREAREALARKVAAASAARAQEPVFEEKQPIEVDPDALAACVGRYESRLGYVVVISEEDGQLYFEREDEEGRTELYPESPTRYFVRYPLAEITLSFETDGGTQAQRIVIDMGGMIDTVTRVE